MTKKPLKLNLILLFSVLVLQITGTLEASNHKFVCNSETKSMTFETVEINIDRSELAQAIQDARALHNNSVEGTGEGQFKIGSKTILQAAIDSAVINFKTDSLTDKEIEQAIAFLHDACMTFESGAVVNHIRVVDAIATKESKYLFTNLVLLSKKGLLFGHQDDTAYGIGWWDEDARSDIFDVCGSYPAVYGWELGELELSRSKNLDDVNFKRMKFWIRAAYERGGINTISWHSTNPFSGGSAWDKTPAVASILPGGIHHEKYKTWLDRLAIFFKSLRSEKGNSIPIIFRPFHEHLGAWFWWGRGNCSAEEYNQVWQFTVDYLINKKNVHNLLFAISPSPFKNQAEYLERYPGDDYVDVLGVDDYDNYYSGNYANGFRMLRTIVQMADERNKVAALTEMGISLKDATCWTKFLRALKNDTTARKICYMHVWRNASTDHFFAPYPGQITAPDFVNFYNDPFTMFEDDLPDVYQINTSDKTPPAFNLAPPKTFTAYNDSVTLKFRTNERAYIRYCSTDQSYLDMPFEFQNDQGGTKHSTIIIGENGQSYTYYFRAMDHLGNTMDTSAVVTFSINTSVKPVSWKNPLYDYSSWKTGGAPLGFGTCEAVSLISQTQTAYFRKNFEIMTPSAITYLTAIVKYDNGAVVYLNGHEIERISMPSGDIYYSTWATDNSSGYKAICLDADELCLLKDGTNVIAVEMHQNPSDSSDLIFDLRLINPDPVIDFGSEWFYFDHGDQPKDQTIATEIDHLNSKMPGEFALFQNYPNPFNALTAIRYQLAASSQVKVIVYNLAGEKICNLVDEKQDAGYYQVQFIASDFASGIYFYQVKTGDFFTTKKMLIIK